ncbi:DNRLRE domain-containing protein [Streptosporangium canum]|uniref:DNRLRE domain-containing protein n=1 Tax=Streptosporangium canum TaxID=324952 RepID=UPI0037A61032
MTLKTGRGGHSPSLSNSRRHKRRLANATAATMAATMVISLAAAPSWAQQEPPSPPAPTQSAPAQAQPAPAPKGGTPVVDKAVETAKKKAHETGKRVEIPSQQTESTTVFANPDGKTLRMELHTQPIRVKKAKGEGFTPIDTTLVEDNGVIKPKAVKGDLTLSAGQDTVLLKSKTERGTAEIAAPGKLAKPKLTGSTATYASAYGEGVDLVVTATATGFRQKIVIRERLSGPATFRLPVDLPKGMSYGTNAAGQPTLLAEDGKKTVAEVRPALVLDAVAADPNGPIDAGKVGKAPVRVEQDSSALVFTPDPAFLADPAVTYPVTVMAADSDWWEPALGNDTFVNSADYPDGYANSGLDRILVGKSNSGSVRWRGYIRFDEIPADSPLRGGTVDNADLTLWNYLSNDCGLYVGSGITARRITERWDVSTLTWSNQPLATSAGADTEYGAYSTDCSGSMNYASDLIHSVNDIVQAWAGGAPNYGFQLTAGNESDLTNWRRYRSQEQTDGWGAHGPQLTVDFTPPVTTRTLLSWSESGPARTSAPSPEEALSLAQGYYPNVPTFPELTDEEAVQLEGERGRPYLIGTEQLQPLDGEDWSQPDPEADEMMPQVIGVTPAEDTKDAPASTKVTVTFDEPVTGAVISVADSTGASVPGTAEMDATGKTLTFTPDQHLKVGVRYTAEVRDGRDASSNRMDEYLWSFTIGGLAASWTFDEGTGTTAADNSGNGHRATLSRTVSWIAGKSGNAISNTSAHALVVASQEAARQGKAIEVADATSANSVTYAMSDGSVKTEITTGPVRTRHGDKWVPIDTSLVEVGDVLKPKALAEGAAVEVSNGGASAFVTMATGGQKYALRWPAVLPKPTIRKNTATFTDAAGKGVDLVVTVLPTGFRHDVVLRERPAKPLELRIGVETGGLTLTKGKGGRLLLTGTKAGTTGKGTELVASAPQPVMWDASAGARLATGRLPQARHAKIATDVVTTGGRTELVLKPDHAFLSDPATKYPVRVDPTTTLPFNHDVEVSSTTDADWPADPTGAFMMAGTQTGSLKYRVHLRFDTAALTGTTVSDAKLSLNTIDAPACGAAVGAGIQVRRLTGAWDENNLHWANKPASTTEDAQTNTAGINQDCATWPGSMDWNVTGIAQDWATGAANHGLVLQSPTETNVNNYRVFTASEDTDFTTPPKLTVTTTGPASAPAISALTVTPAQDVSGVTTVTSLTPQLAATVTDPIGGTLTGEFEIEHDPAATGQGTGQIWAGTSAAVTSGAQATAAVPNGKLTDGWKVRWRARAANTAAATTSAWSAWQNATIDVPGPISEPAVGALQVTPSTVVDGTTVTSTLTPTLLAQVSDPAGGSLRAEYELEHDPAAPQGQGAGQIWTGAVDNVVSGTQAGIAVPIGKLTDGWQVRWRARAAAGQLSSAWSDWQQLTIDIAQPGEEPLAQTTGPVIRTDQSFTATAWLRWNDKDGDYSVIEQKGTHTAPFRLGNTLDHGLVFTLTSADAADATTEGVLSGVEPPTGEWFHLAGVYDATAKTATLYLNGSLVKTAPVGFTTWNADTAMTLGSSMHGDLDDARVYQQALTAEQMMGLLIPQTADTSAMTAKAEARVPTAQAVADFNYERISLDQCEAGRDARVGESSTFNVGMGWDKLTPYTGCWSRHQMFAVYEVSEKYYESCKCTKPDPADIEDFLNFDMTVVMHSYLGDSSGNAVIGGAGNGRLPRDVKVWTRVDNFWTEDDEFWKALLGLGDPDPGELNNTLKLQLEVAGGSTACSVVNSDADNHGPTRTANMANWVASGENTFLVRSASGDPSRCTIMPWLIYNNPRTKGSIDQQVVAAWGNDTWQNTQNEKVRATAPRVRCDSRGMGSAIVWYVGGCIFYGSSRVYHMSTLNLNNGAVARHIQMAFTRPQDTVPLKTDGPKRIPGNWDADNSDPEGKALERVNTKSKIYEANVAAKDAVCDEFFDRRPRQKTTGEADKENWEQCDEYPFASTRQGGGYNHPTYGKNNFSVYSILGGQNTSAGADLNMFYARYRVLNSNQFWVSVK